MMAHQTVPVRPLYLAGRWAQSPSTQPVVNPYDQRTIAHVTLATAEQIEEAIASAKDSFAETRTLPTYVRGEILYHIASRIKERREEFARTIAEEAGKPIRDARGEVDRAISTFRLGAEEALRLEGEYLPLDITPAAAHRFGIVRRFPIGPVAAISPFNFPLNLVAHKVAPALAVGCPVVLKPASKVPLTALLLAEVIDETEWPKGAFSVLPCSRETGEPLVTDPRFAMLSFTGSPSVGWAMKERAGARKRVVLELGGNAGMLVDGSADLEFAAQRAAVGAFSYAGQVCISVQRIYVLDGVADEFQDIFLQKVARLKQGDPLDETTDLGPMIDQAAVEKTALWVREAVSEGADVLAGGSPRESDMRFFPPTVLTNVSRSCRIVSEEAFAPVVVLERVRTFDEGLSMLNDSVFGLQAGIFTHDERHVWKSFETLDVGGVIINDVPTFRVDHMPYGGVKESGYGREGVRYAIEDMTEPRILVITKH